MTRTAQTLAVAAWEFRRYFKWKDQALGLALMIGFSGLGWLVVRFAGGDDGPRTVAVAGVTLPSAPGAGVTFVELGDDPAGLEAAVRSGEVDGALVRAEDGSFELLVERSPAWAAELGMLLGEIVRRERLVAAGVAPAELERLLAPAALAVRYVDGEAADRARGELVAAAVLLALFLMTVFTSSAYLLTGITGEKQLRVTEMIVSVIHPQSWIDGKILGITVYALASVVNLLVGGGVAVLLARSVWTFEIPSLAVRPGAGAVILVSFVLGTLLWNAIFGALAATVDDPNTSSRSSIIVIPILPVVLAMFVLRDPDTVLAQVLSIFPLTSVPALPVRIALGEPAAWEVGLSLALLAGGIWLARRAAGRVFEIGILMYGKEPSLREVWRWATR